VPQDGAEGLKAVTHPWDDVVIILAILLAILVVLEAMGKTNVF
jgi:hypothetical protein